VVLALSEQRLVNHRNGSDLRALLTRLVMAAVRACANVHRDTLPTLPILAWHICPNAPKRKPGKCFGYGVPWLAWHGQANQQWQI